MLFLIIIIQMRRNNSGASEAVRGATNVSVSYYCVFVVYSVFIINVVLY